MRENIASVSWPSEFDLFSLNIMVSNTIHFPANDIIYWARILTRPLHTLQITKICIHSPRKKVLLGSPLDYSGSTEANLTARLAERLQKYASWKRRGGPEGSSAKACKGYIKDLWLSSLICIKMKTICFNFPQKSKGHQANTRSAITHSSLHHRSRFGRNLSSSPTCSKIFNSVKTEKV